MTSSAAAVLSAQEQAIESGKKFLHGNATDRIMRLFDAIRNYGAPRLTLERAVLFTESFKTTEGQPLALRWAKALKHIAENITVTIFPDELIVGRPNIWLGRYGLVCAELDGSLMKEAVGVFKAGAEKQGQEGAARSVAVPPEDEKIIDEVLFPYWNGRDFATAFAKALPEETRHFIFGPDPNNISKETAMLMCTAIWRHSQNWAHDFSKIITRGCSGIRQEAQAKLAKLEHPSSSRPTNGVTARAPPLRRPPLPRTTRKSCTGSATPLSSRGPCSSTTKSPAT